MLTMSRWTKKELGDKGKSMRGGKLMLLMRTSILCSAVAVFQVETAFVGDDVAV